MNKETLQTALAALGAFLLCDNLGILKALRVLIATWAGVA